MRMRFKPYARPELLACDFHVHEPLTHGGHWHELYARPDQPWHLELGCGKGGFLAQIAPAHPDINYLGIDITDKVLILAKRKVEAAYAARGIPADNVKIASLDIERLGNAFTPEDRVSRIYINFCNPWSKNAGSNKRRLTHPRQLLQYRQLMDEVRRSGSRPTTTTCSATAFPTSPPPVEITCRPRPAQKRAGLEPAHRARGHVQRAGHPHQGADRPQGTRQHRDLGGAEGAGQTAGGGR